MAKVPTRSPTDEDIEMRRLASMGMELEEIADGDRVELLKLVELAEERGRPASHYLCAVPLATELTVDSGTAALTLKVCAGNCQRYGARDLLDHLVEKWQAQPSFRLVPVTCLDRCDQAVGAELHGPHGVLVLAPATAATVDEALASLAQG